MFIYKAVVSRILEMEDRPNIEDLTLGLCLQSRFDEVREIIDAERKCPRCDEKFLMMSEAFLLSTNGNNDDISEALRVVESIETDPDKLDMLRTYIHYLGRQYGKVAEFFDESIDDVLLLQIHFETCMLLEKYDMAMKILLKVRGKIPEIMYDECMRRCKCAGDKASIVIEDIKVDGHAHPDPLMEKGQICMVNNDFENGARYIGAYYDKITNPMQKQHTIPLYALCLVKCGRARDAISVLDECILDLPSIHRQRAIAYQLVGDYGLAHDSWIKSGDRLMEAQCLFLIGENGKALNIMKELERDGNVTPLLYELMAQIYEMQGDRKLANRYEMASRKMHRELENESAQ